MPLHNMLLQSLVENLILKWQVAYQKKYFIDLHTITEQ